jgi:hypothetical protein
MRVRIACQQEVSKLEFSALSKLYKSIHLEAVRPVSRHESKMTTDSRLLDRFNTLLIRSGADRIRQGCPSGWFITQS